MPLNEYEFPTSKLANVQAQLERLVEKNYYLHQSAKDAFRWAAGRLGVCFKGGGKAGKPNTTIPRTRTRTHAGVGHLTFA